MGKTKICVALLVTVCLFSGGIAQSVSNEDGSESWGYAEVRPKAHMFWWYYKSPYRKDDPSKPWPIILWLQGGPGGSGVAIGNFKEVGPLDANLKPRNSTWLTKGDLLFVDNPVGTGFSYVEDTNLLVKTDEEAAADLTTLLIKIFNGNETLQKSPLYMVAESYGGKYAVTLGLSALKAIEDGKLKMKLGGLALGDTWISPEDFVFSWGPLLKSVSRLDKNGLQKSNSLAQKIRQQIGSNQFEEASDTWNKLENQISADSNSVDFYNFMLDSDMDPVSAATLSSELHQNIALKKYSRYLNSLRASPGGTVDIDGLMNGAIRDKLKIIPDNFTFGSQSNSVFNSFGGDFMKPRIKEVDDLLARGVNVTIYSGQLDVICSTMGTEAWVEKLKWDGLQTFLNMRRTPLYCNGEGMIKGFSKSYKNLHFYWILGAGHFVPVDQPCITLDMVGSITQSPITSKASVAANVKLTGKSNDNPVAVLPLISKQALRIAIKPPHFSAADNTVARLHTVMAFASIMEYKTAPVEDRISTELAFQRPNKSRALKANDNIAKQVAFIERTSCIARFGLLRARIMDALAKRRKEKLRGRVIRDVGIV
ncbi:hypothetical protein Leryth_020555 [Lithospermum erythrorhizon]|nr:hypothetical protein Leryth_020555 [Lithospermum erythrorhizon]